MDELQVIVKQDPGRISWNFADLKKALEQELEVFQNTVYDDSSIKDAKKDVAALRKLRTAVDDKRKEIREKCLEPFAAIDGQAKELMALIDEPISTINERVQAYETERKARCKKKILEYMARVFSGLPEDIASKAKERLYDPRWENATAKEADWKSAIDCERKRIQDELDGLKRSTEEEFYEDALTVYRRSLSYFEATQKVSELRAQKERILRRQQEERERREREEAARAEKAAREAARAAEAAKVVRGTDPDEAKDARSIPPHASTGAITGADYGSGADATAYAEPPRSNRPTSPYMERPSQAERPETKAPETKAYPNGNMARIVILGTEEQVKKIKNYIRFVGADFREV